MAASFTCDGCGVAVAEPAKVGFVIKRDYCPLCEAAANAFMDAEEACRKEVQAAFMEKRSALIEQHGANGFKLPDVP